MIEFWPHWLRPFWLLLLPVLLWLGWHLWQRPLRSGRWQNLLPEAFHGVLLGGGNGQHSRLPWLLLGLGWLLALLALLGPSWQQVQLTAQKRADPLVVVMDLSQAMLATDTLPNRLQQARRKLLDLFDARADAQTAIVLYAGSAHSLVPLSDDRETAANLLGALNPEIMPLPGARADLGVALAVQLLQQGAAGSGRILLLTDHLTPGQQVTIAGLLQEHGLQLDILGLGSIAGAPVPLADGSFLKLDDGSIALPRLDDAGLRAFAARTGGRYSQLRADDSDLEQLGLLQPASGKSQASQPIRLHLREDAGHWLLLLLLLLAACAGRRGWLLCLPLLILPPPAQAFSFRDLWLRPDQQGQRLLQAGQAQTAAERFENPLWQGVALYAAGDYASAAQRFTQADDASTHYNRGNALAMDNELEAALDAWQTALELQPDLAQARHNIAAVEQLLEQQKDQLVQDNQEQEQGAKADPGSSPSGPSLNQSPPAPGNARPLPAEPASAPTAEPADAPRDSVASASTAAAEGANPGEDTRQSATASATGATQAEGGPTAPATAPAEPGQRPAEPAPAGPQQAPAEPLGEEDQQALEQWLRQIPDDPSALLRRKFWYQQQLQENQP
jgi:Ca-activated chloride channel family protein